jgi:hypothetical protein
MSKNESEKLVAVMLPSDRVRDISKWTDAGSTSIALVDACKRALRPEPPGALLSSLRSAKGSPSGYFYEHGARNSLSLLGDQWELALTWIEYVIEHGWDPSE